MRLFTVVVASAFFALLFAACEGNTTTGKDGDTPAVADDTLLVDEDGITPIDEEPEGETDEDNKSDPDVPKDDVAPVDDGTVEPDDATVVTDDATVEPDDAIVVTDDATV